MKLIMSLCCMLMLLGCGKRTTPKKVERILGKDSWKITEFINNGSDIATTFVSYKFKFEEGGAVRVSGAPDPTGGSWSVGENKNPAIIYFVFPLNDNLHPMSDDWQVTKLSGSACDLTRNDNNNRDKIHLVKL